MDESLENSGNTLTSHFFRTEYGKLVAVISRYLGNHHVETAEDIVQETMLRATSHWEMNGVPDNPKAWLYTTAKNLSLNTIKRGKYQRDYAAKNSLKPNLESAVPFSEELIADSQLRMMFCCCHPSVSENSQIALVLKILSGFSIQEIAHAFFSNTETINKRLVRGRKQLRQVSLELVNEKVINQRLDAVLKTIYLLFNEGYFPSSKNEIIRFDLCLEAIRLAQLLQESKSVQLKTDLHSLLALMYFNVSRFNSRVSKDGKVLDLKEQDRSLWDENSIQTGMQYLEEVTQSHKISKYALLATISAHHCAAPTYEQTKWNDILGLYDQLLSLEQSPIVALNRAVVLSEVEGATKAIEALEVLASQSDIGQYYMYPFTLGELYKRNQEWDKALEAYQNAQRLTANPRDKELLSKKIQDLVPNLPSQLS
ncbi:RNA polymerase sigma factor [Flagellimonas algicola]|uniref:Sigma-70 family RNA polymerase sigma factor n=1 Tax=Flagellimonas algicola TaxID=2583815 RepID=A0ABY2WPQ5_9FLAO|nr:sigma-70 family RNA polymerase sigma factor [Allomuricauda algicola]TMU56971.1 sigma-70 family RNA polymerase sigma factor [Allomuricauda algicola]